MERAVLNSLWDNVTIELNKIGPPALSVQDWRRKWSKRKYAMKKQVLKESVVDSQTGNLFYLFV